MYAADTDTNWPLELFKTIPTVIVGCIAVYIAWRQSQIAKGQKSISAAKLSLDLFEKRLAIFQATWGAASSVPQSAGPILAPASMTNLYPEASFLFGPEIEAYMRELGGKMTELAIIVQMTQKNSNVVPPDYVEKRPELEAWIVNAAMTGVREKFSPYLNFSAWR